MAATSRVFSIFSVLLLACMLTSCASVTPRVDLDSSAKQNIKTVALVEVAEPQVIYVRNIGGVSGAFGLVGAFIQESANSQNTQRLLHEVNSKGIKMGALMTEALKKDLAGMGYQVVSPNGTVSMNADKKPDYSALQADADVILHVWFGGTGYVSPVGSSNFVPQVTVNARILDSRTKREMYYRTYLAGASLPVKDAELVPLDEKYSYASMDALISKSDEAIQGMIRGHRLVSNRLVSDMR